MPRPMVRARQPMALLSSLALLPRAARGLNRLLFTPEELRGREVRIALPDARAAHVHDILRARPGDMLRVGLIDGGASDRARILSLDPLVLELPGDWDPHALSPTPRVDLALALPRPLQLQRMLPVIAQLGVGTLVLLGAAKVDRAYWGSHLLREPHTVERLLVEGLSQCGHTRLPVVRRCKSLRAFLDDTDGWLDARPVRIAAHPQRTDDEPLPSVAQAARGGDRVLLAVGPEGGWADPEELDMLRRRGFKLATLGDRVLRSDVAVIALLSVVTHAHAWVDGDPN